MTENVNQEYLEPTEFFDFHKKRVSWKAKELSAGLSEKPNQIKTLFYFVRDEIKYNMMSYLPQIKANFKASVTLRRGNGFCVSKAILLSTFARSLDIPARIHLADIINHKISPKVERFMGTKTFYYHGYSELYLEGDWIKLTPAFDKETALKAGYLPMCEFDGKNHAMFPEKDINGNKFIEYINDRGVYADLPLDEIEKVFIEKYGDLFRADFKDIPQELD
ncbi:MAG: transglutaminase-like domain-containing protein [Promethearchaeia archaeon]